MALGPVSNRQRAVDVAEGIGALNAKARLWLCRLKARLPGQVGQRPGVSPVWYLLASSSVARGQGDYSGGLLA